MVILSTLVIISFHTLTPRQQRRIPITPLEKAQAILNQGRAEIRSSHAKGTEVQNSQAIGQ